VAELINFIGTAVESEDDLNLTLIRSEGAMLLGKKTRGYGEGKLVLPGGKSRHFVSSMGIGILPYDGEAAREATEESGISIVPGQLAQVAMLYVSTEEDTKIIRVYETHLSRTDVSASEEFSELSWQDEETLPYDNMPEDYRLWLPHVLAGYAVTGFFETDRDALVVTTLYRQRLQPLERAELITQQGA